MQYGSSNFQIISDWERCSNKTHFLNFKEAANGSGDAIDVTSADASTVEVKNEEEKDEPPSAKKKRSEGRSQKKSKATPVDDMESKGRLHRDMAKLLHYCQFLSWIDAVCSMCLVCIQKLLRQLS